MRYTFELTTYVEVEAVNVAQAFKQARKCRVIGSCIGGSRSAKDRDFIRHSVECGASAVRLMGRDES